ncbi:keratinocyte differentiation factor 1 isoform X2 [Scleropages formosus]|uniref:keratinocyte differentiation factor 1 isoform X2 n=1 Tax=Scleropages formosus TaxID=113540 RepID=UPI0010FA92A1|nr:keratinocyte differentiation factor 1 isoform X2 [Scleropages formosus]
MPGHTARAPSKSRSHPRHLDRQEARGYRNSQERYGEAQRPRKVHARLPDRRESETLGFIPGSAEAESPASAPACGPCASLGSWSGCVALVCCVLTCGLYGAPEPCAGAAESSTDPDPGASPVKADTEAQRPEPNGLDSAPRPGKLPASDSFRYRDVCFRGQKVEYTEVDRGGCGASRRYRPPGATGSKGESQRPVSNTSIYSREDLDLDDLSDSNTDIDTLITRKLLELYKLHQIEQLALCTSDSSFSRRTNEISDLINSIAQNYNLQEQEAECRLVQGVIRISTRKSKRPSHAHRDRESAFNGRLDKTLPDSGHETMLDSFGSTEPEVKVSEQTSSDELARKMRLQSGRGSSYSSPYQQEMETNFSGTPLLHSVKP